MAKFVRASKFRHVFGKAQKETYQDIRITKNSSDSTFCAVNPKFVAVVVSAAGGGAFLVLPLEKLGRVDMNAPRVTGHKMDVLDLAWNPFDDNMIASSSEDTTVKIWQIPDGGLTQNLDTPLLELKGPHQRRVGIVMWHPVANNVLLSASHDPLICIWNLETGECVTEIDCHPDLIFSVSWNRDGSKLATTCKDKQIRIIDARSGNVIAKNKGHEGAKPQRVAFCDKYNCVFTSGFSKMSDRQYGVWDDKTLKEKALEDIDSSNGVLFIYYDHDTSMIYLAGKGDANIRYYELVDEEPYCHWITTYGSNLPQRGLGFMPKRGCNVNINEVARFFKLIDTKHICEPISFTVPRKSELFQDDLFPDTQGDEPSLTTAEWLSGKNAQPKLISLKAKFEGKAVGSTKTKTVGLASKMAAKKPGAAVEDDIDVKELIATIKQLKTSVADLEKRVKVLEQDQ